MVDLRKLNAYISAIPADTGGGSPLDKVYVMAGIGAYLDLKTFVEIGVYRGRSFFPLAQSFAERGGRSYGIDPYRRSDAWETDIPADIHDVVVGLIKSTNYDDIYQEVLHRRESLKLSSVTDIIRHPSDEAIKLLRKLNVRADMVHVDGNHDRHQVLKDVKNYIDIMTDGSILILDDIDWPSVGAALAYAQGNLAPIFQTRTYAVLTKSTDTARTQRLSELCPALERHALRFMDQGRKPKVSVSIITFNQERYIGQAITSALSQETDFDVEIVIGEDRSTDRTLAICRQYREQYPNRIHLIERPRNIGAVANYLETYKDCKGEYIAFLEGDDFWIDPRKLQKQVDFLDRNPDYAICFHNVMVADETGRMLRPLFPSLPDTSTAADLCDDDYISTPSCMIRNGQVGRVPDWLYTLPGCDWPFDILNAEQGKIKYLDVTMAAYRQHGTSLWSSLSLRERYTTAAYLGLELDKHFGFRYHAPFSRFIDRNLAALRMTPNAQDHASLGPDDVEQVPVQEERACTMAPAMPSAPGKTGWSRRIERGIRLARKAAMTRIRAAIPSPARKTPEDGQHPVPEQPLDLVIVDDAFPHPQSAFRLEEYQAYLAQLGCVRVYTSGRAFSFFSETRSLVDVIAEHDKQNPALSNRTFSYSKIENGIKARFGYTIFAGNAWENVDFFEKNNIPFAFTLYPGGSFYLHDAVSDQRLRRIFESPMFRKVIVTQQITRNYLEHGKFCSPEQIEFIYGVVTPSSNLAAGSEGHIYYGNEKKRFDICFTAHKYTPDGHDKGYDIFLNVARIMAARFDDCHFHVVGGFQESDLPLDGLEGRITFYGGRTQEWLQDFYRDKDLILLCNVPFIVKPGAFDGFPTGCGSDAMLNGVALFCTDPLHLNREFTDGRDIVLVPHHVETIVERLSWYRSHPEALRVLARHGREQAARVYGFEAQIMPRLALLRKEIAAAGRE